MEILNQAIVTPQRMLALLKIVGVLQNPTPADVLGCLQPADLDGKQDASKMVLSFAKRLELVVENSESGTLSLGSIVPANVADAEVFRQLMQQRLTGVTQPDNDNFLLNQFTAWIAVQGERMVRMKPDDLASAFNADMQERGENEARAFNSTKFNGWRNWATFLGWGYSYSVRDMFPANFVPDASRRLRAVLPDLMSDASWMNAESFLDELALRCPELDGGALYMECWQVSRPLESSRLQSSLMLSTALRVLERTREVELSQKADARTMMTLSPAQGMINRFSHIRRVA